jgi:hypothetical protein
MHAALPGTLVLLSCVSVLGQARPSLLAVDQGSYIQPIARLDGARWVAVAPSGLGQLAPRDWTRFHTGGGSVPVRVSVAEPTGRCATARRLPLASPPAAAAGLDAVYVGLAATGTLAVEPLRRVGASSSEWADLMAAVGRAFASRQGDHGVAAASLAKVPMTIDHAYASGTDRRAAAYYFEASKRVPDAGNTPEEDPQGVVRIVVSGWLTSGAGGFTPAGTRGELLWEPAEATAGAGGPVLSPVGVVRHGAERVWVMRVAQGSQERFTLYALGGTTVRAMFTVDAGAC